MSPFEPVVEGKRATPIVEPDLPTKIRYRLGWSVPEDYRGWVERDIASPSFFWWQLAPLVLGNATGLWLLSSFVERFNPWPYVLGAAIGSVLVAPLIKDYKRRRVLEWHEKRWKRKRERDEGPDIRLFP